MKPLHENFIPARLITILTISSFVLVISCNDKYASDIETYELSIKDKQWFYSGQKDDVLFFEDSIGNEKQLIYNEEHAYFNDAKMPMDLFGWRDIIYAECESVWQSFSFEESSKFLLRISANVPPEKTELELELLDLEITIDLDDLWIKQIIIWKQLDDFSRRGRSQSGDQIESELLMHDFQTINDTVYRDVLEFKLKDLYQHSDSLTVVSLSIGKREGLLSYQLRNGQKYERQSGLLD